MSTCSQCGHENAGDPAHCTKCGKQLLSSCNMCGSRLRPEDTHCPECGTQIIPNEELYMRIAGVGISDEFGNEACVIGISDKRILIVSNKNGISQYTTASLMDVCKVKFKTSIVHAAKGTYAVSFQIASKKAKYGFVSNDGKKFAKRLIKAQKVYKRALRMQQASQANRAKSDAPREKVPLSPAKPVQDVDELIPALGLFCLFVPFLGVFIWLGEKGKHPRKAKRALVIGIIPLFIMVVGPCRSFSGSNQSTEQIIDNEQVISTANETSFVSAIIDEEAYDTAVKTQVERNIIVTGVISHDQLDELLSMQYEEIYSSTGYEYREHPNAVYIYVYTPGNSGTNWIGRLEKHAASNTPAIYNEIPEGVTVHSSTFSSYRESLAEQVIEPEATDTQGAISTRDNDDSSRFELNGEVITDSFTGLQWRVGPDRDTSFSEAVDWANSLGSSWRMPTVAELSALYQAGIVNDDEGLIWSDMFFNTGCWVWSSDCSDNTSARGVYFWGGDVMDYSRSFSMDGRVFAVK